MEIIQQLISKDKYGLKCPYFLDPKYITIHNTGNNASAQNEINYMQRNSNSTGFHIAVDDKVAILGIPLDRNAWHAGDGSNGVGNRQSIGIEICYSTDYSSDRHEKAFYNAVEVTKQLMKQFSIPIDNVKQHYDWNKKDCPHRIRKEGTWSKFLSLCKEESGDVNMTYDMKVVRIPREKNREYRCTVDGNKYGTPYDSTVLSGFGDKDLVSQGFTEEVCTNGSIFFYDGSKCLAEGLEKSRGINNQEFNMSAVSKFAETMAIGLRFDGGIDFLKQKDIQANIDNYYGAITGAFGIMKSGQRCEWGKELESQRNYLYSKRAGRTIVGYDAVNDAYMIISIAGVTGSSGPTGAELYAICKAQGCTDAINLDGSGSRKLRVKGNVIIDGSRKAKNGFLIYSKPYNTQKPEEPSEPGNFPNQELKRITVEKVGLYIRDKIGGNIIGFIPVGSFQDFNYIEFIKGIQKDGYQHCKVSGTWLYKGNKYVNQDGYVQYDSTCYHVS